MSEMHDRVTETLMPALLHISNADHRKIVAASWALSAIVAMRAPTSEMLAVSTDEGKDYQAMVDTILSDQK